LRRRCERALVRAARSTTAGSRQQIRAAARHFTHRHRRDHAYLAWVLRCVATSAATAVALLGLRVEPASASGTRFTEALGFGGLDVGSFSTVAAGDLDADGDPDFVASESFATGAIHYFQNTGNGFDLHVVERTGVSNPFNGLNAGFTPRLALAD